MVCDCLPGEMSPSNFIQYMELGGVTGGFTSPFQSTRVRVLTVIDHVRASIFVAAISIPGTGYAIIQSLYLLVSADTAIDATP